MKALVIGGNGFIGSHLVDELVEKGHDVRVVDRSLLTYSNPISKVDYRICDFADQLAVADALEGIEVVFHLLSTTVPFTSNLDPAGDINSNLVGTVRLLEAMNKKRIKRIVFLSSGGTVYGFPKKSPISETHPLNPICSYGVVKVAIEKYLFMYQELYGLVPVILRPSNPYGERQTHSGVQGVIGTFMNKITNGQAIEVWGDGTVIRDFVYVKDLVRLCRIVSETNETGIFNAGTGVGHSIIDVINLLSAILNYDVTVQYKDAKKYDVKSSVLNISQAAKRFGWKPKTDLESGLKIVYKWSLNQFGGTH